MLLALIQEKIQKLYSLEDIPDISKFLISKDKIESLHLMVRPQVVVRQQGEEVELGVYLGESLEDVETVDAYAVLVEEVSHFIYLFWNLTHDQPFSLLDVEVQGEIDKFLFFADQLGFSDQVVQKIFGHYLLRENLPPEETQRYHQAHRLGQRFIRKMLRADLKYTETLKFLRAFYRQGSAKRIRQIYHAL
ncbi:MAG: hypothetical protein R3A45_02175 [Bdellovibrionota bacterium]|nr:hypothetical protein [Deltaproteobacteria bacterium]